MQAVIQVVRIYGTDNEIGDVPRTAPEPGEWTIENFPESDQRLTVFFGRIPEEIRDAELIRIARGRSMMRRAFAGEGRAADVASVAAELRAAEPTKPLIPERKWYVTVMHERETSLEGRPALDDTRFQPDELFKLEAPATQHAKPLLDIAAAISDLVVIRTSSCVSGSSSPIASPTTLPTSTR